MTQLFPIPVSVIIVSYNTREKLRRCLSCLSDQLEVIVVDNASSDGSAEMVGTEFPGVNLIANDTNLGFGLANNLGAASAHGEALLYLNSDAYAESGAIHILYGAMKNAGASAAGGKLLNPDRSLQHSVAGRLTLGAVFLEQFFLDGVARRLGGGYWRTDRLSMTQVSKVDQVMGACLMVKRDAPKFKSDYFLYCEDTDLCYEITKSGGSIMYVPEAEFIHELGSSSTNSRWLSVARYNRGKETYFRRHHGRASQAFCWILNRTGALLRLIFGLIGFAFSATAKEKAKIFLRVLLARKAQIIPREYIP